MKNKKELRNWLDEFNLNHPLTIAGPCSAETEEQVLKIAHSLKDTKATVFSCLLYTSPSPRDVEESRMPSSA